MTDRHEWGPFPKPAPAVRLAGATIAGFAIGIGVGAYHRTWGFTLLSGLITGTVCGTAMVTKLALEARHRRAHRPVVREPRHSNIVALRRDPAA